MKISLVVSDIILIFAPELCIFTVMTTAISRKSMSIEQLSAIARRTMPEGSSVWLYGSRARGTAREDSDWDILILIDKAEIDDDDFEKYSYPLMEYGWRYGVDLAPQLYTRDEWKQMAITPFYQNVEKDKKIIYGAE